MPGHDPLPRPCHAEGLFEGRIRGNSGLPFCSLRKKRTTNNDHHARTEPAVATSSGEESQTWGGIAFGFAGQIAGENFQRGDLAQYGEWTRRTGRRGILAVDGRPRLLSNSSWEAKWALILHGIALMTRHPAARSPIASPMTDTCRWAGRCSWAVMPGGRESGYYSESRLNRLLTARGPILRTLLARMFRMMAATINRSTGVRWPGSFSTRVITKNRQNKPAAVSPASITRRNDAASRPLHPTTSNESRTKELSEWSLQGFCKFTPCTHTRQPF